MKTSLLNPVLDQGLIDLSKVNLSPDRPRELVPQVQSVKVLSAVALSGLDLPDHITVTLAPKDMPSCAETFRLNLLKSRSEILAGEPPCYRIERDNNFVASLSVNMDLIFHGTLFDFKLTNIAQKKPLEGLALLQSLLRQQIGKPWTRPQLAALQPPPPAVGTPAQTLRPFQAAQAQVEAHLALARETGKVHRRQKDPIEDALVQQRQILAEAARVLERLEVKDLSEIELFEKRKLNGRLLFAQAYNSLRMALTIDTRKKPLQEIEEAFGSAIAKFGEALEFHNELKNEAEIRSGLTHAHLALSKLYVRLAKSAPGTELRNQLYTQAFFSFLSGEGAVTRACELMAARKGDETERLRGELKTIGRELLKLQMSPDRRSEHLLSRALYYLWHGRFANCGEFVRVLMENRNVAGVQQVLFEIAKQPYCANSLMKALIAADRLVRMAGGPDYAEVVAFNSEWRATAQGDFKGEAEIDVLLRVKRKDNKLGLDALLYPIEVKHTQDATSVREWRSAIDETALLDQLRRQNSLCENLKALGYPMGQVLFVLIGPRLRDQTHFLPAFLPRTAGLCLRINHGSDSSVKVPFPSTEQVQKWLKQTNNIKFILREQYPDIGNQPDLAVGA